MIPFFCACVRVCEHACVQSYHFFLTTINFKFMSMQVNLNLNNLLVTRQMTLFHQGVRMGEKVVIKHQ